MSKFLNSAQILAVLSAEIPDLKSNDVSLASAIAGLAADIEELDEETTKYATCSTAASETAKAVTLTGYALHTGVFVAIKFQNAVPASATLNINNTGAKPLYWNDAAIPAGIIGAGNTAVVTYDGTNYDVISVSAIGSGGDISELETRVSTLETKVSTMETITLPGIEIDISKLKTSTLNIQAVLDELRNTTLSDLDLRVSELETSVFPTMEHKVDLAIAGVSALELRTSTLETSTLPALSLRVSALEAGGGGGGGGDLSPLTSSELDTIWNNVYT